MLNLKAEHVIFNKSCETCLSDPLLSLSAKGLYTYLLSSPSNIEHLASMRISEDSSESIHQFLEELQEADYLSFNDKDR